MASHSTSSNSQDVVLLFEQFCSEITTLLCQFENIFTHEVKSCFESEDEMISVTKKLLKKFFKIESLNAFSVNFFHKIFSRSAYNMYIVLCFTDYYKNIVKKFYIEAYSIIKYNKFFQFEESHCKCKDGFEVVCDGQCAERGSIIAPCCSLFNHSCFPNCGRMFAEKKKMVIMTTLPIKRGEQVQYKSIL